MEKREIQMGTMSHVWGADSDTKDITFCLTEDCNLRCKYCYMTGKNSDNKMNIIIAKKAVDYFLENRDIFKEEKVIWNFIGGEPLLEIDMLDEIVDYIKLKMYKLDHPWFNAYRISISTNGILYHIDKVQKFITKNKKHLSIGITIDGNKIKHDLMRVKQNGDGSYNDVIKNIPLWLSQFKNAETKVTFASDDLIYLKDSIIHLWELGFKKIPANVVFENVWKEGDDVIYESQLKELADYIIDHEMYYDYSVKFFDPKIGNPLTKLEKERNWCGAGQMIAIDTKGKFYPCIRFLDFCLNGKENRTVGDVFNGVNLDLLRPFQTLSLEAQSDPQCVTCEVASGCSWCTGANYDSSESGTIYQRSTAICKMHKANVRACNYFWGELSRRKGLCRPGNEGKNEKYLLFITTDDLTPHCCYNNLNKNKRKMGQELFGKGIEYAKKNGYIPVILKKTAININSEKYPNGEINDNESKAGDIVTCNLQNIDTIKHINCSIINVNINRNDLAKLSKAVELLIVQSDRINILISDMDKWCDDHIVIYEEQLEKIVESIHENYRSGNLKEINVLTDPFFLESRCNCGAGTDSVSLAPDGNFYFCPGFYFDIDQYSIGNIDSGIIIKNKELLQIERAPLCRTCKAYHCKRCLLLNLKLTKEINCPPKIQCVISHIELKIASRIQKIIKNFPEFDSIKEIGVVDNMDPLEAYLKQLKA
jgi:uncharacterized protein